MHNTTSTPRATHHFGGAPVYEAPALGYRDVVVGADPNSEGIAVYVGSLDRHEADLYVQRVREQTFADARRIGAYGR